MTVRPAKTQISLGIYPVGSASSLFAWRKLGSLATHWAPAKTQISLSEFLGFCHVVAHIVLWTVKALVRLPECAGWPKPSLFAYLICDKYPFNMGWLFIEESPKENIAVFSEKTCPPPPKPVYGGNFSHEAVTLKIRSRSPKSNKLLILSDLYRLANLVTFHPMVHEITCRQTLFWLNFGGLQYTQRNVMISHA